MLDLKGKEKKKTMAELEGEVQSHFEGVGAVINNDVFPTTATTTTI